MSRAIDTEKTKPKWVEADFTRLLAVLKLEQIRSSTVGVLAQPTGTYVSVKRKKMSVEAVARLNRTKNQDKL